MSKDKTEKVRELATQFPSFGLIYIKEILIENQWDVEKVKEILGGKCKFSIRSFSHTNYGFGDQVARKKK